MALIKPGEVKGATACKNGELVRFDLGGPVLAIALDLLSEHHLRTYLVLESAMHDVPPFSVVPLDCDHLCFSYGGGWVLEMAADGQSFPGNPDGADTVGEIRIHDAGVTSIIVNVLDAKMNAKVALLDLATYTPVKHDRRHGARIQSWKIWAKEEERLRVGGRPIVTFPAQ
ncbi:hypothetical protein EN814_16290 [Mesorhizobium sp. M2D.F.Ca.ET.171.01.1.1]|uniref:hypothetical protein n=1 Tax=unclassified Mesorhizobium TaxID=325217 RepID=UPI001091C921|nr:MULTISPECIES: hypothetical protein [unclassified Mesorhizobium]TGS95261.1 hypothetical protein EN821_16305 [Mesorhizobium sp. M2D.F.Ca.ET.178.01.1.1]TGT10800.1 hypothetical protein EN814_16290 [Mesorhizobium sp. M2D.F.Ca.ET.171.01.1.1]